LPDCGSSPRKSGARFRRKGTRFSRASVLRSGQTRALLAFFFAAVYWCFVVSFWLGSDPFKASLPVAAAWIAGFAVGALALLVAPWILAIVGFFVVFLLGSAGVGPF
jgi:hypothetical protein